MLAGLAPPNLAEEIDQGRAFIAASVGNTAAS